MTRTRPTRPQPYPEGLDFAEASPLATVIASAPGVMAQSLRAMFESLPSVRVVGMAAGCLSALQMLRESQADLVVIDSNVPMEDVHMLLQQIRADGLPARSLVVAATRSHAQRARAAGADLVFRREGSTGQLRGLLAKLVDA